MSHSGSDFYKPFIFVLGALLLLTFFLVFAANTLSPDSGDDPLAIAEMKRSIAPVGRSRVVEEALPVESAEGDAAVEASQTESSQAQTAVAAEVEAEKPDEVVGDDSATASEAVKAAPAATATAAISSTAASLKVKAVVATNCAGCHNDGLHGAAKTDDAAAWSALADKGIDELTASVINGKGKMPARAESTLNDDEIRQAVELMIANAAGIAPTAASTAGTAVASTAAVAAVSTAATDTTETVADAAAPVAEIPAAVKQVVDSACAACHQAGVANAPKFGDKEAWAPRLEKGIDALVASSIAGIGIMPPRGGSTLDEDQMRLAVEYMLSK